MHAITLNPVREQADQLSVNFDPASAMRGSRSSPSAGPLGDLDVDSTVSSRTYLETEGFRAVVSLGAIVPGHTLIIPTVEIREAVAAFSVLDHVTRSGLHRALEACTKSVQERLSKRYEPRQIMFEHGGLSQDYTHMCGTCFPHLHVLPTSTIDHTFRNTVIRSCRFLCDYFREYDSLSEFYESSRGDGEYLMAADKTGVSVLWAGSHLTFPSQVLRHVVQDCVGLPRNKWQDNPDLEGAVAIANALRV